MREFTAARTLFDRLNVNIARRLDARVPQHALGVLERPVLLHVRPQCSPHHLEGNQPIRDLKPVQLELLA